MVLSEKYLFIHFISSFIHSAQKIHLSVQTDITIQRPARCGQVRAGELMSVISVIHYTVQCY